MKTSSQNNLNQQTAQLILHVTYFLFSTTTFSYCKGELSVSLQKITFNNHLTFFALLYDKVVGGDFSDNILTADC